MRLRLFWPIMPVLMVIVAAIIVLDQHENDTWHYIFHGDDRITYDSRHFVNPTEVSVGQNQLISTGKRFWGDRIYVSSASDLRRLPVAIFIKKNRKVIEYTLSGGF